LIQSLEARPHYGELRVEFGPSARIDAAGLVEMWRASRWRTTYHLPSNRSSGQAAVSATFDTTGANAKENTSHGLGAFAVRSATFDQGAGTTGPNGVTVVQLNATTEAVSLARVNPADGSVLAADGDGHPVGRIALALPDAAGHEVTLREMSVCDPATGASKKVRVLASAPY